MEYCKIIWTIWGEMSKEVRSFLYTKDNIDVLCELNADVQSVAWFLLIVPLTFKVLDFMLRQW